MTVLNVIDRVKPSLGKLAMTLAVFSLALSHAHAVRIKDIADIKGVRQNQLVGYGLVVGLNGTGDSEDSIFTNQSVSALLEKMGVKKGDRVFIYLPILPELPISMLACARIGAIHHITFAGFGSQTVCDRINNCAASVLICCDGYYHGGEVVDTKSKADIALENCPTVKDVIVVRRCGNQVSLKEGRDYWWHDLVSAEDLTATN